MNSKLKAFTLFELVIGMLLSALVIGMVYSGYQILSKVSSNYIASSVKQSQLMQLEQTLQKDFDRASAIQAVPGQLHLVDSLGIPQVSYLIEANQLLRKSRMLDSFSTEGLQLELRFEKSLRQNGLVDELKLQFKFSGTELRMAVSKQYSSQQLLNAKL